MLLGPNQGFLVLTRVFFLITATNPKLDQQHQTLIATKPSSSSFLRVLRFVVAHCSGGGEQASNEVVEGLLLFLFTCFGYQAGFLAVELMVFFVFPLELKERRSLSFG